MKKIQWISLMALIAVSCKTSLNVSGIEAHKNIGIEANMSEDATVLATIAPYKQSLQQKMSAKISHTNVELTRAGDNCNLGNLLADFTLESANEWAKTQNIPSVDAALINIGGIRTNIPKGDITLRNIYEVMPFENQLVIVKLTGEEMKELFAYYVKTQKNNPVSQMYIEVAEHQLVEAKINGKPLEINRDYYIATSDYLALGGDSMKFFSLGKMINTELRLRDLYIEKFKNNPEIKASNEVRLVFKR